MISTSTLSLSNIPPSPATAPSFSDLKPISPTSSSDSLSSPESQSRRIKSSPQLNRWSRARAVRSGRKLSRVVERSVAEMTVSDFPARLVSDSSGSGNELSPQIDGEPLTDVRAGAKSIYMVSDGTGWTVEHSVTAALGQFEHCFVDRGCPVSTHLFSGVS